MFLPAIDYLNGYRTKRADSLQNISRMRWFSSESPTLAAMIQTFLSTVEDIEWEKLDDRTKQPGQKVGYEEYQAVRIKIAFLAGCRHDLRGQFVVEVPYDPKTACDFERHAFADVKHAHRNTNQLAIVVAGKASIGTPA